AARVHVLFSLGRAAGADTAGGRDGLSPARPPRRRGGGARRAQAHRPGVLEAGCVARTDAGGGAPRCEAGPHLRHGGAPQLAAALAHARVGGARVPGARPHRHDQRRRRPPSGAAGSPAQRPRSHGDTRYDSVAERAERFDRTRDPFARLAIAPAGTFTIVAGSTWPADEAVVLPAFLDFVAQVPSARLVLAPHEPNPDHLAGITQLAAKLG